MENSRPSPTPITKRPTPVDRQIARRWQEWLPWCTLEAAKYAGIWQQPDKLAAYQTAHHLAASQCLRAGIPWATILRHRMDDPRISQAARDNQIKQAIERRRCRMGRVKGQRRESYGKSALAIMIEGADAVFTLEAVTDAFSIDTKGKL